MNTTESTGIKCPYADKQNRNYIRTSIGLVIVSLVLLPTIKNLGILPTTGTLTTALCVQGILFIWAWVAWASEKKHGRTEAFRQGRASALGIAWGINELIPSSNYQVLLAVRKDGQVYLRLGRLGEDMSKKPVWCMLSESNFDTSLRQVQAHDIGQIRVWAGANEEGGTDKIVTAIRRPPPTVPAKKARITLPGPYIPKDDTTTPPPSNP